jgi:hypothetical protein
MNVFSTTIIQLPVLRSRCFPGNRDHGIHTHVHSYKIDNFVDTTFPNPIESQICSAQDTGYVVAVVDPPMVQLLPSVDN